MGLSALRDELLKGPAPGEDERSLIHIVEENEGIRNLRSRIRIQKQNANRVSRRPRLLLL